MYQMLLVCLKSYKHKSTWSVEKSWQAYLQRCVLRPFLRVMFVYNCVNFYLFDNDKCCMRKEIIVNCSYFQCTLLAFIHVSRKKRINALSIFKQTSKHDDVLFPFKKESKKVMLLLSNFIVAVEKSMYGKERERTGKRDYQPFFRANDMEGNIWCHYHIFRII